MTLILAFLLMLIFVFAMSLGVMMGRKPIAGSCGGMKALGLDGQCSCGGTPGDCRKDEQGLSRLPAARRQAAALAVDAAEAQTRGTRTL